jgi:hypothetical protein
MFEESGCPPAPPALQLLAPATSHLIEKLKAEQACGIHGAYLYMGQTYEQLGAGHYLMARLMWDASADARALEKKYYEALYGPAAADVKAYYDLLEGRLCKVLLEHETSDEPAAANLRTRYENSLCAGELFAAYWPVLKQAEALMAQAQGRPVSDLEKQRLARLLDQHELLVSTVRGMVAACRLESQTVYNDADVAMFRAASQTREAVKERLSVSAPTLLPGLKESDASDTSRLLPGGGFFRSILSGRPPHLAAPAVGAPPKIDGKADDPAWRQCPAAYFVGTKDAAAMPLGARALMAHDAKHLYVYVEGREPGRESLRKTVIGHDDAEVFDDDSVEIFLAPPGGDYYQIAVGAGGGIYDAAHRGGAGAGGDTAWESRAKARVRIYQSGWSAEVAVPLESLGAKPGNGWRANVCRTRRGNASPAEYTAVIPTFAEYHAPNRFAALLFDPPAAAVVPEGTFDDVVSIEKAQNLKVQLEKGATARLVGDRAWCGPQALHVVVPPGGTAKV